MTSGDKSFTLNDNRNRRIDERQGGPVDRKAAIAAGPDSGVSDRTLDDIWNAAEARHRGTNR